MYNTPNYNISMYNALTSSEVLLDYDIEFNGYPLQTSEIIITKLQHESTPARDFNIVAKPYNNGQLALSDYWRTKIIKMEGVIKAETMELLELKLDEFKKNLSGQEGVLNISYGGSVRSYVCTLISGDGMFDRQAYNLTFIPFAISFVCMKPFGEDKNYTTNSNSSSSLSLTLTRNNLGTVTADPIFILNFSSASGITSILLENLTTGQSIEYVGTVTAPAILEFNSENKIVKINDVNVDYQGEFISLSTGENTVRITINGVSANYIVTAQHKNAYL